MSRSDERASSPDDREGRSFATVAAVLEDSRILAGAGDLVPDQVIALAGGADAQTYLVKGDDQDVVVKLDGTGLEAETRALEAWKPHSGRITEVLAVGSIPGPGGDRSVKYLVLAGMSNDEGHLIETAADFLDREPRKAGEVGRALGAELHALHQAVGGPGFGNFDDSPGSDRSYATWGDYLGDFLEHKKLFLRELGIEDEGIAATTEFIRASPAVAEGRYLHGDVSVRNVAVLRYKPVTVGLFDPNPVIGDPSWDIAPMANNVAFNELRIKPGEQPSEELQRDRDLLSGFWESYPDRPAEDSMLAAQLVQAVLQSEHRQARVRAKEGPAEEHEATRQFIARLVGRVAR